MTELDVAVLERALRDTLENRFGGVLSIHYDGVLGMKPLAVAKALAPELADQYAYELTRADTKP